MRTACFLIAVLLASALVNASSSLAARKESSISESIGRGLRGLFAGRGRIWSSAGQEAVLGASKRLHAAKLRSGIRAQRGRHVERVAMECMTKEHCDKEKVVCTKKCPKSHGKCAAKCKKCIPTC